MKFLLISDLDNTWIGDDSATIALQEKLFLYRDRFYLVYATGRSFPSVVHLMRDFWLSTGETFLKPDYLITGVGSEIYHQGILDYDWAKNISQGWDRNRVVQLTQKFPQLLPQSETEQNPWKVSFCLHPNTKPAILNTVHENILEMGIQAKIIFSSGKDIDILPQAADKGLAAMYLREKLQIPLTQTLVCGDSGNDLSLYQHGTLGVIVNNAQNELAQWYNQSGTKNHYFAKSSYAWGILEAIDYFSLGQEKN
ncbi:sucrose-phosphate phosphatase [Aphanothece hegewaldii CCALA 016]|uniref:sucrose-phosphate phosphatase n=1 Tax=Aphanothece hegewaldii CCALA 016 TaxID=2107694 RepID=A0A2T1M352_9CHRO|nr:sucrose-phosphate phosphatase [Aphanothece hegewaldii]PSF39255.1 sucrose-phosphate phosphatase [Aphanothece hegewaldii CCALA 016]